MFNDFSSFAAWMEDAVNLEKKTDQYSVRTYRLDRMNALLSVIGNPQESYKTIHIAGSKGKGSTASYISCGLKALGYKTGLYLSPHVSDIRERFTIDGSFADEELLIKTANELACAIEGFYFEERLGRTSVTTFELYTAFAFLLFKNAGCNWAVIETGLGGRLDATNILKPQASVLTRIELEHTDILGDTITKIATEKSKIIKENVPSFIAYETQDAYKVFQKEALEKNSKQYLLKEELSKLNAIQTLEGQKVNIDFKDGYKANLNLKMLGKVQAENCALAILVLRRLGLYKEGISEEKIEKNFLPGRMEKVPFIRPLYMDGAHTVESMRNLMNTFKTIYPDNGICIFGCVSGKKYEQMCALILENFNTVVVSRPGTFKKSDPAKLYNTLRSMAGKDKRIILKEESKEALKWCIENSEPSTPILACGSFYLAGALKEAL